MLVIGFDILAAVETLEKDRHSYYIQKQELAGLALELRKDVFHSYFYTFRQGPGFSKNKLSDPEDWYHELNSANLFEPRCKKPDDFKPYWCLSHVDEYCKPKDKDIVTIEDVVVEMAEKDEPVTGLTCTRVRLSLVTLYFCPTCLVYHCCCCCCCCCCCSPSSEKKLLCEPSPSHEEEVGDLQPKKKGKLFQQKQENRPVEQKSKGKIENTEYRQRRIA